MATFSRPFEGTVRIRINPETDNLYLDRGVKGSTLTAADAVKIAEMSLEAALKHKVGLNRWTFYVAGESQKLPKKGEANYATATLPAAAVKKALKEGFKVSLKAVKYGKPSLWLIPADETPKAKSSIIDIA